MSVSQQSAQASSTPQSRTTAPSRGGNTERAKPVAGTYAKRGYTAERAAANILPAVERNRAVPIAPGSPRHVRAVAHRSPVARWLSATLANIAK